jgi:hypothetical protein
MTLASLPLLKLFLNNRPVELEKASLDQKLMICTDKVLGEWAQLAGHRVEDPGQRPEEGLQTLIAAMHGPQNGLLSVATTPRLGTLLAVGATGDPSAASFSQEALLEFYRLLRECIIQDGLGADCRDFLLHTQGNRDKHRPPTRQQFHTCTQITCICNRDLKDVHP